MRHETSAYLTVRNWSLRFSLRYPNHGRMITRNAPRLTLEGTRAILAAAEKKALAIKVPMNIAIVDCGAHLLAFIRKDGAKLSWTFLKTNPSYTPLSRPFRMSSARHTSAVQQPRRASTWPNAQQKISRKCSPVAVPRTSSTHKFLEISSALSPAA
jgi:uncharacterized protein GlcG (DUF336 family)